MLSYCPQRCIAPRTRSLAAVGPATAPLAGTRRRGAPLARPSATRTAGCVAALSSGGRGRRRCRCWQWRWSGALRRYGDVRTPGEDVSDVRKLIVSIPAPREGAPVARNVDRDDDPVHVERVFRSPVVLGVPHLAIREEKWCLPEAIFSVRSIQTQPITIETSMRRRNLPHDLNNFARSPTRLNYARSFQKGGSGRLVRIAVGFQGSGGPRLGCTISDCRHVLTTPTI